MIDAAKRVTVFALYQFSIAAGILLLPLALAVSRFGLSIPAHRVVNALEDAYEQTCAETPD